MLIHIEEVGDVIDICLHILTVPYELEVVRLPPPSSALYLFAPLLLSLEFPCFGGVLYIR